GVPARDIVSYRAGNFGASNQIWDCMRQVGLKVSSNINRCYLGKNCKMEFPGRRPGLFATGVEGVWELPVSNIEQPDGRARHLQLTAASFEEMRFALWQFRALGVRHVTLVTHSFEFFHIDSVVARQGRVSRINRWRLRRLLRFLREHPSEFRVATVR